MGERCGCVSSECTCVVQAGPGIDIDGTGRSTNPLTVNLGASSTKLVGVGSSYLNISVTGDGQAATPYVISGVKSALVPPNRPLRVYQFTAAGAYTVQKPAGCSLVEVVLIGAGAGGQSAGSNSGTYVGGIGGSGGGRVATSIPVTTPASEFDCLVNVGPGGTGGTNPSGTSSPPGSGTVGGPTTITLDDPAGDISIAAPGGNPAQGVSPGQGGLGSTKGQTALAGVFSPLVGTLAAGAGGRGGAGNFEPSNGTGGGKHSQFAVVRTNLVRNSGFLSGISDWESRTNVTLSWAMSQGATPGTGCLEATLVATATGEVQESFTGVNASPVIAGEVYGFGFKVWPAFAGRGMRIGIGFWTASGAPLYAAFSGTYSAIGGAWNSMFTTHTAPPTAAFARVMVGYDGGSAGEKFLVDHVILEKGAIELGYFDGDTPSTATVGYSWTGSRGNSRSIAVTEDPALSLALRGGGIGGNGGNGGSGIAQGTPGPGGGGGGAGWSTSSTGGRGGDGAAWVIFY